MRRRMLRLAVVLLSLFVVLGLAFAGLTARLFFSPSSSTPKHADAVVILSGDFGGRIIEARRLMSKHVAPVLVLAGTVDTGPLRQLCAGEGSYESVCVSPVPDSTRAEARALRRLARQRGWH